MRTHRTELKQMNTIPLTVVNLIEQNRTTSIVAAANQTTLQAVKESLDSPFFASAHLAVYDSVGNNISSKIVSEYFGETIYLAWGIISHQACPLCSSEEQST